MAIIGCHWFSDDLGQIAAWLIHPFLMKKTTAQRYSDTFTNKGAMSRHTRPWRVDRINQACHLCLSLPITPLSSRLQRRIYYFENPTQWGQVKCVKNKY